MRVIVQPSLLAVLVFLSTAPAGLAAQATPADTAIGCYWYRASDSGVVSRAVRGGFRVEIAPHQRGTGDDCRLEIRNARDSVLLRYIGFSASLEATDIDLDNDGDPDLLIEVDEGGGNRCCRIKRAIALDSGAHLLWELGPQAVGVERHASGTLLHVTHPFYDLGPSMAESPFIEQVLRPTPAGLQDVTDRHCREILDPRDGALRFEWEALTEERKRLLATAPPDTLKGDARWVAGQVYSIVLQYAFCGRAAELRSLVEETLPRWLRPEFARRARWALGTMDPTAAGRLGTLFAETPR